MGQGGEEQSWSGKEVDQVQKGIVSAAVAKLIPISIPIPFLGLYPLYYWCRSKQTHLSSRSFPMGKGADVTLSRVVFRDSPQPRPDTVHTTVAWLCHQGWDFNRTGLSILYLIKFLLKIPQLSVRAQLGAAGETMLKRGENIPDEILVGIMVEQIRYEMAESAPLYLNVIHPNWFQVRQVLPPSLTMITEWSGNNLLLKSFRWLMEARTHCHCSKCDLICSANGNQKALQLMIIQYLFSP